VLIKVLGYIRDLYDFRRVRYSSSGSVAEDVMRLAKERLEDTLAKLEL